LLLRLQLAALRRARGLVLSGLGAFAPGTSRAITFGKAPRFINSRAIRLGTGSGFGDFARIECYSTANSRSSAPVIEIGERASFGDCVHLGAISGIQIGRSVLCGSKVIIIDHNHGLTGAELETESNTPPAERKLVGRGPIVVEDNVWIGEGACILGGVTVGFGAVIGANSVVTKDVPPRTTYIGRVTI